MALPFSLIATMSGHWKPTPITDSLKLDIATVTGNSAYPTS